MEDWEVWLFLLGFAAGAALWIKSIVKSVKQDAWVLSKNGRNAVRQAAEQMGHDLTRVYQGEVCPLCRAPKNPLKQVCPACGATVVEDCPKCGKSKPVQVPVCLSCGQEFEIDTRHAA